MSKKKVAPVQETSANPNQIVFGYLVGVHKTVKAGKLINTQTGELDGTPVLVKTYELTEEESFSEKPWYLETAAGPVLAATPYAYREQMETAAPEGFQVVWKLNPPPKRGRKRKVEQAQAQPSTENNEVPFDQEEEIEEL